MKSLKKTLVLLVVFSMILSAVMPAFAANLTDIYGLDCEEEVARLEALEVVSGYEDGTYKPENTITRAEMAVILCKMVGIDSVTVDENKNVPSKFSDVPAGEWYTGHINVAAGKGLLSGFPDGTFRPNEQLTMNQVLTLCVNALGRGEYVSEMGTWPANYIAEATKLGLLDDVKTSDANRGNVAIIVWNTLEAPYVWDVSQTEYEGTINLGNSSRSLLSIYFRDYVFTEETEAGEVAGYPLKEVEYMTVSQVPATDGNLGEYQIELTPEDDYANGFLDAFDVRPPRNTDEKEWTTQDGGVITAYAPSFDNLDSLYGKVVTVIFGKDNEVVSIREIDETVEDEYLTAFEDSKLEIGENTYRFDDEARVFVNTVEMTDNNTDAEEAMADIEGILGINFDETYSKVIKANVVLNNSGRVTRLDLFVSGTYEDFLTKEAIVERVRNEVISLSNNEEIDYSEDVDEDDLPRFIKDGAIISAEDIVVGDVLTYYYKDNTAETMTTVYVSSARKEGELTRASKTDLKLTIDGEAYYSSNGLLMVTTDKVSDAEDKTDNGADDYIGENVELYLNIYGEYVLMASEKASENWTFGIVTTVRDTEDDEEDVDVYYIPVRILLADGTTSREYKFIYDVEDDEDTIEDWEKAVEDLENEFIVFSANANKEIEYFDAYVVDEDLATNTNGDYEAEIVAVGTATDADRERIEGKVFSSSTVIFNTGDKDGSDPEKASVSTDWKILVDANDNLAQDALIIYEEDSKTLSYVGIDVADFATSDAEYAIVLQDDFKEKRGTTVKKYVELLTVDGAEEIEAKDTEEDYLVNMEEYFVEYALSGSKLDAATWLIDLPEFADLKAGDEITNEINEASNETKLVVTLFDAADGEEDAVHGTVECDGTCTADARCNGYQAAVATTNAKHGTVPTCPSGCTTVDHDHSEATATAWKHEDTCAAGAGAPCDSDTCSEISPCTPVETAWNSCKATKECPNAADLEATECNCSGFTKYVAGTEETHGTVACPHAEDLDATECDCDGFTAYVAGTEEGTIKANFKVVDTQKLLLEYEDDENEVEKSFKEVIVDEDVVVYDARGGEIKEITFSALRDEVETEGDLYVIPFANSDAAGYNTADVEANILVIVD